jgi:hypothetical protein
MRASIGFGQLLAQRLAFSLQHLADTGDLGGFRADGSGVLTGDQHMHVAADLGSGGQRLVGRVRQAAIVVFCNKSTWPYQILLLRSSACRPVRRHRSTFSPAWRTGGSVT